MAVQTHLPSKTHDFAPTNTIGIFRFKVTRAFESVPSVLKVCVGYATP